LAVWGWSLHNTAYRINAIAWVYIYTMTVSILRRLRNDRFNYESAAGIQKKKMYVYAVCRLRHTADRTGNGFFFKAGAMGMVMNMEIQVCICVKLRGGVDLK
jgi:hypothetical protein